MKKLFSTLFCFNTICFADVVKPTLVEIIANTNGIVKVEIRTSIEALLTGINNKYKTTRESPQAKKYDTLRNLPSEKLLQQFNSFKAIFLQEIKLKIDGEKINIDIENIKIPEVGYPKVPRISLINLRAIIPKNSQTLSWYYPLKFSDNAVRVKQINSEQQLWHWTSWQWLKEDKPSKTFSLHKLFQPISIWQQITTYLKLGIFHIVPKGVDHILFILGIFLFSLKINPLLTQITMFTVAHTITLSLAMNNIINLPANFIEPLIALSIAYIGFENIWLRNIQYSRLILVFVFGLLHGLGFASVLSDFGMPKDNFIIALVSFNLGVEVAQISLIICAFLLVKPFKGTVFWQHSKDVLSLSICIIGIYWVLERVLLI